MVFCLAYNAVFYPQIFDKIPILKNEITFLLRSINEDVICFILLTGIFFLILSFYASRGKRKSKKVIFFIILFMLVAVPQKSTHQKVNVNKGGELPNIIIFSVDSLREDANFDNLAKKDSNFFSFLSSAIKFRHVISPVPQTHPALTALLTGKSPLENKIRINLSHHALNQNALFQRSILNEFKKNRYSINYFNTAHGFSYFENKDIFNSSIAPKASVETLIYPFFLQHLIMITFLNNMFGRKMFPEIYLNNYYWPYLKTEQLTQKIIEKIDSLKKNSGPFIFFAHIDLLHWPLYLPRPYFLEVSDNRNINFPQFSAGSMYQLNHLLSEDFLDKNKRDSRIIFQKKVYNTAVKMIVEQFLEPVFENMFTDLDRKNTIVVLMSDHGESINHDGIFPKQILPKHGNSLLFSADSERAYFRAYFPQLKKKSIANNISLQHIFPLILNYISHKKEKLTAKLMVNFKKYAVNFTETSEWTSSAFVGGFSLINKRNYTKNFLIDLDSQKMFINPKIEPELIFSKQRAAYYGQYRLTLFLTKYGYQSFLCDVENDIYCYMDLSKKKPGIFKYLSVSLLNHFKNDLTANGKNNDLVEFQQATELLYKEHNFPKSYRILKKLLNNKELSIFLKNKIILLISEVCRFSPDQDHFFETLSIKKISSILPQESLDYDSAFQIFSCLKGVFAENEANEYLKILYKGNVPLFRDYQIHSIINKFNTENQYQFIKDKILLSEINREHALGYIRLFASADKYNSIEINFLQTIFKKKYKISLEKESIFSPLIIYGFDQNTSYSLLLSYAKAYYRTPLEYSLREELDSYHSDLILIVKKRFNKMLPELLYEFIKENKMSISAFQKVIQEVNYITVNKSKAKQLPITNNLSVRKKISIIKDYMYNLLCPNNLYSFCHSKKT